jgi:hypothetical protein
MNHYGSLASEFYDLDKPEAPPDALDFYLEFAREAAGPIHEPMCGNGRFLLPMLAEGLDASGSDASPQMLAACRARASQRGLSAPVSEQRLETLVCQPAPALIIIPSGSFGLLLDDALVTAALARLHEQLAPGGSLLVEVERSLPQPPAMSGVWGGRWLERPDGARLILSWLSQYSGNAHITSSVHRYELVKDGQLIASEYDDFQVRSYESGEFRALLETAGFKAIRELRPYERVSADETDEAIVFYATKA